MPGSATARTKKTTHKNPRRRTASPLVGNALVGQAGGPTVVINQSLVGVISAAQREKAIPRVYGARHGIMGILTDQLIDLGRQPARVLERVAQTPASALGSVRKQPKPEECERIVEAFRRHDIRYFFYIGGNDTAETALAIQAAARAAAYEMRVFHVPKTIDNDLRVTDHCPGYGSAARFVACALAGDDLDNRSLPGIKIDVIMGRHAGFLAAASALARREPDDGPHLIYLPEVDFSADRFLEDVDAVYGRLGRCVVAVSEGIHDAQGRLIIESGEKDSHGNVQLSGTGALGDLLALRVKERFGKSIRVRADTLGYLQRSFLGVVSAVDAAEARAVGREAVRAALSGKHDSGSIAIRRRPGKKYAVDYLVTPLDTVARVTRSIERAWINARGNDVEPQFLDYARPLVGKLPIVGHLENRKIVGR
ncbi:MAG: 6-phosphofructokinase [Betaproteobacteria bacterium]|nr:6-phosphofructokinase [Betaproteobacteria bacterium]